MFLDDADRKEIGIDHEPQDVLKFKDSKKNYVIFKFMSTILSYYFKCFWVILLVKNILHSIIRKNFASKML